MQKVFWILFFFLISFFVNTQQAQAFSVEAHFFYGVGCPHCEQENTFLKKLAQSEPALTIHEYEIYYNSQNKQLLQQVAKNLKTEVGGVPFLVIGDQSFVGFRDGVTSLEIEKAVSYCLSNSCDDVVAEVANLNEQNTSENVSVDSTQVESVTDKNNTENYQDKHKFTLPIVGEVDLSSFSLPLLTVILAFLDGFNPCAMWALLFLITLLLGLKDKKRMWILGTIFVVTSALVYFLFLAAWLNFFMFLGFVVWIRNLIGVVAILAAYHYLKDYFVNKSGGCSVMGDEKRQKIFVRLRKITEKKQFALAIVGIMLLAVAVNMVELICSAGLPAIYTQILSLAHLETWQYYLYLMLYILIFMLDDLFIFFTAMITLQVVGVQSKYARYSHLVGGLLMAIIGLLLLFKPEWLMFG